MKITNIVVRAGRTFNHPHEQYSNLKAEVELSATLDDGDDAKVAVQQLQSQAEGMVEDHKQGLLKSIRELYEMTEQQAELSGLQTQLQRAQDRIEEIRRAHPSLKLIAE